MLSYSEPTSSHCGNRTNSLSPPMHWDPTNHLCWSSLKSLFFGWPYKRLRGHDRRTRSLGAMVRLAQYNTPGGESSRRECVGVTGRSSGSTRGSGRTAGREEDDGDELGENRESGRRAGRTETKEKNGGRNGDKLGEEQGARDTSGRRTEAGERAGTTATGGEFPGREPGQPGEIWVLPELVPGFPVR